MADVYNFLVAHPRPHEVLSVANFDADLRAWMYKAGEQISRCGGRGKKIIKYSEKKYLKDLHDGAIGEIELYSDRIWEESGGSEMLNCNFSAVLSGEAGLLLSAFSEKMKLEALVESFYEFDRWSESFDYIYSYGESHAYGFGYARGIYMLDEKHPLMWPRRNEVGIWWKKQRAGTTDSFIRDVYPVNIFSDRKLSALPPEKRTALESAMKRFGVCDTRGEFTVWALDNHELETVRTELKAVELLASYCP